MKLLIIKTVLYLTMMACTTIPNSRKDIKDWSKKELAAQINPFISDGCSAFPEGTKEDHNKWLKCCVIHDLAYWAGGDKQQKLKADQNLKKCVQLKDEKIISEMMYYGTRIGGKPQYKTDFRWGYGWNYTRGYLKLTKVEMSYVEKLRPKNGEDLRKYISQSFLAEEGEELKPIIFNK